MTKFLEEGMRRMSLVRLTPRAGAHGMAVLLRSGPDPALRLCDGITNKHPSLDLAVSRWHLLAHGTRTFPAADRERTPRVRAAKPCFPCPQNPAVDWLVACNCELSVWPHKRLIRQGHDKVSGRGHEENEPRSVDAQ